MEDIRMTEAERRLAEIIWAAEPLPSPELVRRCQTALGWKKSTTYTMLHRLEQKGIFVNEAGTVRAVLDRAAYEAAQAEQIVEAEFSGSLPRFFAAFTRGKPLSRREAEELRRLIDACGKE